MMSRERTLNYGIGAGVPILIGIMLVGFLLATSVSMIGTATIHPAFQTQATYSQPVDPDLPSVLVSDPERPTFMDRCACCGKEFGTVDEAHKHLSICLPCAEKNEVMGWSGSESLP